MKYESAIDITKSLEYQQGYKDGYFKAIEQLKDMIFFNPSNPQIIVTTKENLSELRERISNGAFEKTTY